MDQFRVTQGIEFDVQMHSREQLWLFLPEMDDLMDPSFSGPLYVLSSEASSAQAALP